MSARGPDGSGTWHDDDARIGLAHRRLAIIDLNDRARQPMSSTDGRFVVTFNGEIYNYRALRVELEQRGHQFRTESDTEVLLALYAADGEALVHRLRGMYAFAIWDRERKRMLLARDPFGIKPLYYSNDGFSIRVASQVKALLAGGHVSRAPDPAGVVGFAMFGSVPEPWTSYRDIRALPAGHLVWIDENGMQKPRSFASITRSLAHASSNAEHVDDERMTGRLKAALLDSVRHHLVADVPVGAFLSSGIDSTTLVALLTEAGYRDVRTVTMAFEPYLGLGEDEVPLAERVARQYGTHHTTCRVTSNGFFAALPAILEAMDQPSIDGINTWLVSRAARDTGLKVAVSGLGGDELFGGYPSFRQVPKWVIALKLLSTMPLLGDATRGAVQSLARVVPLSPKAPGLLTYGGTYGGAYFLRRGLFMPWELPSILPKDTVEAGLNAFDPVEHVSTVLEPDPGTPFARVAALEASLYMRNQLLRDTDWASMSQGIEVRVPYVDFQLLQAVAPLLVRRRRVSKRLLAATTSPPLIEEVIERRKSGFAVPMAAWLEDRRSGLDEWRRIPALATRQCHWSRRLAYVLLQRQVRS